MTLKQRIIEMCRNCLSTKKGFEKMAKSKEQHVHEVFENISENYDKMNSVISFQMHKMARRYMKQMNVKQVLNA